MSDLVEIDYLSYPLPPPWRKIDDSGKASFRFLNERTGELILDHPFERAHMLVNKNLKDDSLLNSAYETQNYLNTKEVSLSGEIVGRKDLKFVDFRCTWKESGLFGETKAFGLVIRYFSDNSTKIKFDGIDGEWILTTLEGPYGPIDRHDLFLGAKVRIFGRHLTITSADSSVCHGIEKKAEKLTKKIAWLQEKIEKVGAVPLIRRQAPVVTRNIVREANSSGHSNLRKLKNDVSKLSEQLLDLGLSHLLLTETL